MANEETQGRRQYATDDEDGFTIEEIEKILADAKDIGMTHMLGSRVTFARYKPSTIKSWRRSEKPEVADGATYSSYPVDRKD